MDVAAVGRWVVVAMLVVAAVPAGAGAVDATGSTEGPLALSADVDPDSVLLSVDVTEDGDATWVVEYRVRLDDENDTEAFRSLQSDIEANESEYTSDFATGIRSTVRNAENATGRNMSASNFSVDATLQESLGQRYGIVAYQFSWENFAAVADDEIRAGDALAGFFLDAETTMIFSYPADYDVVEVQPEPSERRESAVVWDGRLDFTGGEPRLVVAPAAAPTTDGQPGPTDGGGFVPLAVGGVVVLLLAAGGYVAMRRGGWSAGGRDGDDAGGTAEETSGAAMAGGGPSETRTQEQAADATADSEGGGVPPEELLSNEERVERFLRESGGRAKQQEVVESMGWTEAKTSQVVKKMRENDDLESFRIGRENVLKLPEADGLGEGDGADDDDGADRDGAEDGDGSTDGEDT